MGRKVDVDDLIDLPGIAELTGAQRGTVGKWLERGKLGPPLREDLSRPLFLLSEIRDRLPVP